MTLGNFMKINATPRTILTVEGQVAFQILDYNDQNIERLKRSKEMFKYFSKYQVSYVCATWDGSMHVTIEV